MIETWHISSSLCLGQGELASFVDVSLVNLLMEFMSGLSSPAVIESGGRSHYH